VATFWSNTVSLLLLALLVTLGACVSSEESGGTARATAPQPMIPPADTGTRLTPPDRPVQQQAAVSRTRKTPKVTTKRDTVQASVVRRSRPAARKVRAIQRPANPNYTVQVGAFSKAGNALRFQRTTKQRNPGLPVCNTYDASDKLYRVSVGLFKTKQEADRLRRELKKQSPKDYPDAWVIYSNR
jgi:cell division septation protein DedD